VERTAVTDQVSVGDGPEASRMPRPVMCSGDGAVYGNGGRLTTLEVEPPQQ